MKISLFIIFVNQKYIFNNTSLDRNTFGPLANILLHNSLRQSTTSVTSAAVCRCFRALLMHTAPAVLGLKGSFSFHRSSTACRPGLTRPLQNTSISSSQSSLTVCSVHKLIASSHSRYFRSNLWPVVFPSQQVT